MEYADHICEMFGLFPLNLNTNVSESLRCKIVGVILTVISIILSSVTVVKKISYDVSAKDELLEVSRLFASSMPHPTVTLCSSNQLRFYIEQKARYIS